MWAREHAGEVSKAAHEQLKAHHQQAVADQEAAAAAAASAAAAAARRAQLGWQAGNAFAAVVKQAAAQQQGGAAGSRRGSALPALALQKLTHRWHRKAEELASAAGERTARQRREAAARAALRDQWAQVRERLPAPEAQPG